MTTPVFVRWRAHPTRELARERSAAWWTANGYRPVYVDTDHQPFNRAACFNRAVELAENMGVDQVILADADTHPTSPAPFARALAEHRENPGRIRLPYGNYRIVDPVRGRTILTMPWACSGILITTPDVWWTVGGTDERFDRWAPEDYALHIAHTVILGHPFDRTDGADVVAYQHAPDVNRIGAADNDPLRVHYHRYKRALDAWEAGDQLAARAIVDQLTTGNRPKETP